MSYPVACNWKVYADNYLEGYHVPHVHPELNKLLDYRSYVTEPTAGIHCNTARSNAPAISTATASRCISTFGRT
ncbi:MAG: hypothetical protein IPF83_05145 [Rhodanobacteraceae bacterium]|nr:hypothetical protein [Rhodanobacteraceae bacterium]